jgi:hypothetical protein
MASQSQPVTAQTSLATQSAEPSAAANPLTQFARAVIENVREEVRDEVAHALALAATCPCAAKLDAVREMHDALSLCQHALAMLTAPDAIRSTTVHHAWAQAVMAETRARAALAKANWS